MVQCNAIAHMHFDGAQLNPPAATTAQELEALLGTEPNLIGDHIGLCVGLKFDMQFNDDLRVYKGTVAKVKQLRHKTVYVCEYDDAATLCSTPKKSCGLHFAVRSSPDFENSAKVRSSSSLLHAFIHHKPRPIY
jgi:hypothetical protein